jgi:hypothetical protein
MSFQAYLDNIEAKTGKPAREIAEKVRAQGLAKPAEIIAWLKADYDLGHGHAMAIVSLVRSDGRPPQSADDKLTGYFSGANAKWRAAFDRLAEQVQGFGSDVTVGTGATYLSLLKGGRKFAIVQASGARLDVGLKLKGEPATERLQAAGAWNAMVTHRVEVSDAAQLDPEVMEWLQQAYAKA